MNPLIWMIWVLCYHIGRGGSRLLEKTKTGETFPVHSSFRVMCQFGESGTGPLWHTKLWFVIQWGFSYDAVALMLLTLLANGLLINSTLYILFLPLHFPTLPTTDCFLKNSKSIACKREYLHGKVPLELYYHPKCII